jgi:hypothetical protein
MRLNITVKHGPELLAELKGVKDLNPKGVTLHDLQSIPDLEQQLERLTGLRFHISALVNIV